MAEVITKPNTQTKTAEKKLNRAISISELESIEFKDFPWDGDWFELLGDVEFAGTWLLWGDSGNGKTTGALQLCKYLASKGIKTAYNSLEQGKSKSMRRQTRLVNMKEVKSNFILLDREPIEDLKIRLRKRRSPEFVVIDSLQYSGLTYKQYQDLKQEFDRKKLILFLSHAEGQQPEGRVAKKIRYDVDVKLRCEGYRITTLSRMGGGKPYDVWPEGARKYYNEDL